MHARLVILFLVSFILAGCASSARSPAEVSISLNQLKMHPPDITVRAGTMVTFVNNDVVAHNVVNATAAEATRLVPSAGQASGGVAKPGFESARLAPGDKWQARFDEQRTYDILCVTDAHYAAGMTGRIRVR